MSDSVCLKAEKDFHSGRLVCVYDSTGRYHLAEAETIIKVEDVQSAISGLQHIRDKANGIERAHIVRTIEFLEDALRTQPRH